MTIKEFCEAYKAKNFMNTKQGADDKMAWINKELCVREYVPFAVKRKIAEDVVAKNMTVVDGIKKYDSISGYVDLMAASIMVHTNLAFEDRIADYDMLAESGLLPQIITQFQGSHDEIDLLRKMVLDMELADNCTSALVGRFLNKISGVLDGVLDAFKDKFDGFDIKNIFGADIKEEDFAHLMGFLDKIK